MHDMLQLLCEASLEAFSLDALSEIYLPDGKTLGHRYTSSKGLVSEKQLSQTSFTTLAAWTSSLHSGLLATDKTALRLMHS